MFRQLKPTVFSKTTNCFVALSMLAFGLLLSGSSQAQLHKSDSIYDIWRDIGYMKFSGDKLFVQTPNAVKEIDYSMAESPKIVATHRRDAYDTFFNSDNYILIDKYLIKGTNGGNSIFGYTGHLEVFDTSNLSTPVYSNQVGTGISLNTHLFGGRYIIIKAYSGSFPLTSTTLYCYDVKNPAYPQNKGQIDYFPSEIFLEDRDLIVGDTVYTIRDQELWLVNYALPTLPDTLSKYAIKGPDAKVILYKEGTIFWAYSGANSIDVYELIGNNLIWQYDFDMPAGRKYGNSSYYSIKDKALFYPTDSAEIVRIPFINNGKMPVMDQVGLGEGEAMWESSWDTTDYSGSDHWQLSDTLIRFYGSGIHDDWLVSKEISVVDSNTIFQLDYLMHNNIQQTSILISENYSGNPKSASWDTLDFKPYKSSRFEWKGIAQFDLRSYRGKKVHIAVRVFSQSTIYTNVNLSNMRILQTDIHNMDSTDGKWKYRDGAWTVLSDDGFRPYNTANEDWLISDAIPVYKDSLNYLRFKSKLYIYKYNAAAGHLCEVLLSTDYNGHNPKSASWKKLEGINMPVLTKASNDFWSFGPVSLDAFQGDTVYIAFRYKSQSPNFPEWLIKDFSVYRAKGEIPHAPQIFNLNPDYYSLNAIKGLQVNSTNPNLALVAHEPTDLSTTSKDFRLSFIDISKADSLREAFIIHQNFESPDAFNSFLFKDSLVVVHEDKARTIIYSLKNNHSLKKESEFTNEDLIPLHFFGDYLLASGNSLKLYDLSDPSDPVQVYQFQGTYYQPIDVKKNDTLFYLLKNTGLFYSIDIEVWSSANPSSPRKISTLRLNNSFNQFYVANNLFYFYGTGSSGAITTYKYSNGQFIKKASYFVKSPTRDIVFSDDYAFIAVDSYKNDPDSVGIRVIDLQNPNSLEVAYMLKDHGGCLQLAIEDDILLASYENTVVSYDLTDIPAQPSSFSLISPNGQIKNTDTTLLWHKSTDPNRNEVEYEVWMADNDQFNNKIVERTKDTFLHVNNLLPEQTVYWKVWALDDIKDSVESSETFQFNLPAMECLSPSGYIVQGNTDTSLVWSPGVNDEKAYLTYRVWVADNEQFNNKTIHQTSDTFLNISNLLPGQKKYWKVFAYNQQSDSMVSKNELNFELANIWLNGPMGSLRKGLSDTTLSWNPRIRGNTEAIDYDILLSTEENFTNAIFLSSQDTFVNVYGLQGGQTYHWRVRARNLFDTSIFTDFFGKFSIDIDQPDLVFSKNLGASLGGGVSCLQDDALYASSTSKVHRFNTSGQEQYTLEVNGQIKASTSITPDHRVYIASTDNNLYAFNQNGVSVQGWPVALGSQLEASVAIDDDHRLYLGTANGIYQCVSSAGNVLWSYNTGASVKASSAITQGDTLIVVNSQGRVFAFDLNNIQGASPSPIWSIRTNRPISNSPAIKGDAIYLCSDDGYLIKITHGNTAASIAYSKKVATQILSSPVVDEVDIVYFGASWGWVYAIHGKTGETKWQKPTYYSQIKPEAIESTGALSGDGAFFIGDVQGVMYCFNTNNGELFWSYRGPEEVIRGAILYKEKEVFFTSGAMLISLRESNRLGKKTPDYSGWLSFQGNNERTGNLDDIADANTNAIESISEAFGISLYPNPNDGQFFITSNDPNAVFQLEVSDVTGKVIYKNDQFRTASGVVSLELNQGLYFVRLQKEGASAVFRMIVK